MLRLLLGLAGLCALAGIAVLVAVCACARIRRVPGKSDCIVVLGARVWRFGRLSNALRYRCRAACEAWRAGVAPVLIVCGGQGSDEDEAEATAMKRFLIAQGVPAEAVFTDATSTTTRENLVNARAIMAEHGLATCAVCTSDYHLQRALWLARDLGLRATGIAAPSTQNPFNRARGRLRETVSWILYFIKKVFR